MKLYLPLFKPDTRVWYDGKYYTVHHVILNRYDMYVKFNELDKAVHSDKVVLEPTVLELRGKSGDGSVS